MQEAGGESAIMNGMVANLSDADMKGSRLLRRQSQKPAAAADKGSRRAGQKLWPR